MLGPQGSAGPNGSSGQIQTRIARGRVSGLDRGWTGTGPGLERLTGHRVTRSPALGRGWEPLSSPLISRLVSSISDAVLPPLAFGQKVNVGAAPRPTARPRAPFPGGRPRSRR